MSLLVVDRGYKCLHFDGFLFGLCVSIDEQKDTQADRHNAAFNVCILQTAMSMGFGVFRLNFYCFVQSTVACIFACLHTSRHDCCRLAGGDLSAFCGVASCVERGSAPIL